MDKGWIKLHRKILKNQFLNFDTTARYVFIMLMLIVDKDTGEWSGGRKQLSRITGIKETTLYYVLDRIEHATMIDRKVTPKFTTYRICKWHDYQDDRRTHIDTDSTASRHSNKNKEVRSKKNILNTRQASMSPRSLFLSLTDLSEYEAKFPTKNVHLEHEKAKDYLLSKGKVYRDYPAFFRGWLNRSEDRRVTRKPLVIGRAL